MRDQLAAILEKIGLQSLADGLTPPSDSPYATTAVSVLWIDDETFVTTLASEALALDGYVTDSAATLAAGRRKLRAHTYDVLTIDNYLPDGLGTEFIRNLREGRIIGRERGRAQKVILCTSSSRSEVEYILNENTALLCKPFEFEELDQLLKDVLHRSS